MLSDICRETGSDIFPEVKAMPYSLGKTMPDVTFSSSLIKPCPLLEKMQFLKVALPLDISSIDLEQSRIVELVTISELL